MKDSEPPSELVFDPAYVDRVSAEIVIVLGQAKKLVEAGDMGPGLLDLMRHARELHEILTEQLVEAPPAIVAKFGPLSAAMGEGIARLLAAADGSTAPDIPTAH